MSRTPANSTVLLELAGEVAALDAPDKALAARIHCALRGYTIHEDTDPATGHFAFWQGKPKESMCVNCSAWTDPTASLEEAVSLVPEGDRRIEFGSHEEGGAWAYVHTPADVIGEAEVPHGTEAMAICAAALRALAAQSPEVAA